MRNTKNSNYEEIGCCVIDGNSKLGVSERSTLAESMRNVRRGNEISPVEAKFSLREVRLRCILTFEIF